jgi:hypothetical protein
MADSSTRARERLWWLLLPVVVLLAGVMNYFVARPDAGASPEVPRAAVSPDDVTLRVGRTQVLALDWGDEGIALGSAPQRRSTFESVDAEGDRLLLVDHPTSHRGARVRVFAPDEALVSEDLTPPGSTLFTLVPGGYAYVIAKGASSSETLAVVAGGVETTYTIPLNVNSGAIAVLDGDFYVTTMSGASDLQNETLNVEEQLVPVVTDGLQVSDTAAKAGLRRGSRVGGDGRIYVLTESYVGFDTNEAGRFFIECVDTGAKLEVPAGSRLLGVDASGRPWVLVSGRTLPARSRTLSASPGIRDPFDEVLVCSMDGSVPGRSLIPVSPHLADAKTTLCFTGTGLMAAEADAVGVRVWRYEVGSP